MTEQSLAGRAARPRTDVRLAVASLLRADGVVLLHNRVSGAVGLLVPLVIVVATAFGRRASRLGGPDLTIALAVTIGLITSSLLGYAVSMAGDRASGVLQRLRVTPTPPWAIMTSRLVVQVVANLVMAVIVVIVGAVIHDLSLTVAQYAAILAVSVVGAAVFLAIGQALVGLLDSAGAVNAVGRVLFVALLLLGFVGETGLLGGALQSVAQWSPVGALMTLFSHALAWSAWDGQTFGALAVCLGYVVVFAGIGSRWFRWAGR